MTTDKGIELKVEISAKERYQQLLNFTTIGVLKFEQQIPSSQEIITLPMTPIINSSFNKHTMPIKAMCLHKNLYGLPKYCPNKINKAPCKICYTSKMKTINKGTIVGTSNLQSTWSIPRCPLRYHYLVHSENNSYFVLIAPIRDVELTYIFRPVFFLCT